jgi:hypothetical protein
MEFEQQQVQLTVGHIGRNYKGRDCDDAPWCVPEHQRFYVWKHPEQNLLIDSIMRGYIIPPIMLHYNSERRCFDIEDGQQRVETIWLYMNNRYGWKNDDGALVYFNHPEKQSLTELERFKFNSHPLFTIQFKNATPEIIAEIFERFNSGKPLDDNDKLWNRKTYPLVRFTLETLFDTFLERARKVWGDFDAGFPGKTRKCLSNAVGIIAGCMHGSEYITSSFIRLSSILQQEITEEMKARCFTRLDRLLRLYEMVDEMHPYPELAIISGTTASNKPRTVRAATKIKEQFTLGKFSAYFIHDMDSDRDVDWRRFLVATRRAPKYGLDNYLKGEGGGANNINVKKLKRGILAFEALAEAGFPVASDYDGSDEEEEAESE